VRISAGTKLGRYEIRSKLGEGGMGEVYLAQDTKLNRKVAIKFLTADSLASELANKRLLREAEAAASSTVRTSAPFTKWLKKSRLLRNPLKERARTHA